VTWDFAELRAPKDKLFGEKGILYRDNNIVVY
jgi:hypothetical protein